MSIYKYEELIGDAYIRMGRQIERLTPEHWRTERRVTFEPSRIANTYRSCLIIITDFTRPCWQTNSSSWGVSVMCLPGHTWAVTSHRAMPVKACIIIQVAFLYIRTCTVCIQVSRYFNLTIRQLWNQSQTTQSVLTLSLSRHWLSEMLRGHYKRPY